MSEITKIAENATEEIYGYVSTDGWGGIDFARKEIVKIIEGAARAAIEAYEAEKGKLKEMSETVVNDKSGREWIVRWPKSQEVKVMGIDFVAWDVQP